MLRCSARWRGIGIAALGATTTMSGLYLATRNPRTNVEDDIAWGVWSVGMFLIGAGAGVACKRSRSDIAILGIAFPIGGFLLLAALYWTYMIVQSFF